MKHVVPSQWTDEVQLGVVLAEGLVARAALLAAELEEGVRAPASSPRPHRRSPTEEELAAKAWERRSVRLMHKHAHSRRPTPSARRQSWPHNTTTKLHVLSGITV